MRLHVIALPHTETVREYDHCAYTAKTRKFVGMMTKAGHHVTLYAGDRNEAECAEHVTCISRGQQGLLCGEWWHARRVFEVSYDSTETYWSLFLDNAIRELGERLQPHDVICLTAGYAQRRIRDAFPGHTCCEPGVGYEGVITDYCVYESYAWMHSVYGKNGPSSVAADGRFFDDVIPNFYDPDEFQRGPGDGGYFAFMSRMTTRKGYSIAIDATKRSGSTLRIAGVGGDSVDEFHVSHVGLVHGQARSEFLGDATALFVPTMYLEPFGGVAVEAMLCGTPVITTDWGAFTENVRDGVDGFRCRTMAEFVQATEDVKHLDRDEIRRNAMTRFTLDAVTPAYDRFFKRLDSLWSDGFYAETA